MIQFLKRLSIIVSAIVGIVVYFVAMSHVYFWLANIHMSDSVRTVIVWVCLIAALCVAVYGVVQLLYGLWMLAKWLFAPFVQRKESSK